MLETCSALVALQLLFVCACVGPGVCKECVDERGNTTGEILQSRARTRHRHHFQGLKHGLFFSVGWRGVLKRGKAVTVALHCPTPGCPNLWGLQPGCDDKAVVGSCSVCWTARMEESCAETMGPEMNSYPDEREDLQVDDESALSDSVSSADFLSHDEGDDR